MTRGVILVVALAVTACGGDEDDPLADAERAMAELDAGRIELQLAATAGADDPAGPVGFRVEGPFSYSGDGELAVVDLSYTQLLGEQQLTTRVVSTGSAAYVVDGDEVIELAGDDTAPLRLGDGNGGVTDLGIGGWIRDPQVSESDDGRTITGEVAVADFLADLARVGAQVAGDPDLAALDDDTATRLDGLAQSSEAAVVLGDDDLPQSVRLVVDFGGDVPPELTEALGPYASTRLELTMELERLTEPLQVDAPTG